MKMEHLFTAVHAAALVWCDTSTEEYSDYKKLASLGYGKLDFKWHCAPDALPPAVRESIVKSARCMISRRGDSFSVSQSGQTVELGCDLPPEPPKNPNENCLEGMACPMCGSFGPFHIEIKRIAIVEMSDDGYEETKNDGDSEWNDKSYCECRACGFAKDQWGVKMFKGEVEDTAPNTADCGGECHADCVEVDGKTPCEKDTDNAKS